MSMESVLGGVQDASVVEIVLVSSQVKTLEK